MSPQPPRKPDAKVEGRDKASDAKGAMEAFKTLTERLLRVPRGELTERQRLYEQQMRGKKPPDT